MLTCTFKMNVDMVWRLHLNKVAKRHNFFKKLKCTPQSTIVLFNRENEGWCFFPFPYSERVQVDGNYVIHKHLVEYPVQILGMGICYVYCEWGNLVNSFMIFSISSMVISLFRLSLLKSIW